MVPITIPCRFDHFDRALFLLTLSLLLFGAGARSLPAQSAPAEPAGSPAATAQASPSARSESVAPELVDALERLGDGLPSEASEALASLLERGHDQGDDFTEAVAAWGLAATRIEQGRFAEARELAARSARSADRAGASDWVRQAHDLQEEATRLLDADTADTTLARSHFLERLGLLEMNLYRFGRALHRFDDALSLIQGRGMTVQEAGLRAYRGTALSVLRKPEAAAADLRDFQEAARQEDPQVAPVAGLLSDLVLGVGSGELDSALQQLETLGDRYRDRLPPLYFDNLKLVSLLRENKLDEAVALCGQMLSTDVSEASDSVVHLMQGVRLNCSLTDFLASVGDSGPSSADLLQLVGQVGTLVEGQPAAVQDALRSMVGQVTQMAQNPEQPERWPSGPELQRSLDGLEHLVSAAAPPGLRSGLDDALAPFAQLFTLIDTKTGNVAGSFEHAEQARARELLDGLVDARVVEQPYEAQAVEIASLRRRRDALEARVTEAIWNPSEENDFDAAQEELTDVRREIDATFNRLSLQGPSTERARPLPLAAIQHQLDPDTTLVAYLVSSSTGDETLAWVVHHDGIDLVPLDTKARELEDRVARFREDIRNHLPIEHDAEDLYRLVWSPLRDKVGTRRVVLIPHGPLVELPFAALLDPDTHRWLIRDLALLYAPSASAYARLRQRPSEGGGSVLVLGDPTGELPAARAEARAVAAIWGSRPLLGPDATEDALRTFGPGASLIHIASHGVIDRTDPLFTHLELAPSLTPPGDPRTDGRLEIHEIASQLRLPRTDLVVLPACHTGEGPRTGGDEVTNLARAFLLAGARSTVTTSWAVDDQATADLMVELERHLAAGEPSSDALREAQLHTLETPGRSHPWYWAGFALHGAGGRVAGSRRLSGRCPRCCRGSASQGRGFS